MLYDFIPVCNLFIYMLSINNEIDTQETQQDKKEKCCRAVEGKHQRTNKKEEKRQEKREKQVGSTRSQLNI